MRKTVIYGIILIQLLFIYSLSRGLWETLSSRQRIDKLQSERERLIEENNKLRETLELSESDYYIEKIARDELHLTKEGETLVIVEDGAIPEILGMDIENDQKELKNWQKWVEVLFGGG